jgi:hypothetical protein
MLKYLLAPLLAFVFLASPVAAKDLRPYILVYWVDKNEIPIKPSAKITAKGSEEHLHVSEIYFNNQVACSRALALLILNFDSEAQGVCLSQGLTTTP